VKLYSPVSLKAERQLLQDVSHELRSPLARLSFAAELVKTAPDRAAAVARLRREIDRLSELVSSLLQVTRLEAEPSLRHSDNVCLTDLLLHIAADCELEASARGCRIMVGAAPDIEAKGDRELIRRAVENVVRNAVRYAPPGSSIDLGLDSGGGKAVISVRDYGPGVPEEALTKIFSLQEPMTRSMKNGITVR
jgi:two-component system, OmpR family, sensor histidine kinase CpxA